MNPEATVELEGTSEVAPAPMTANSPSPIPEISLADPPAVATSLATVDQAALSLMVISRGSLEGQTTPTLKGKEAIVTMDEDVGKSPTMYFALWYTTSWHLYPIVLCVTMWHSYLAVLRVAMWRIYLAMV